MKNTDRTLQLVNGGCHFFILALKRQHVSSPELVPLFTFLLFWGSLCFPLTRQKIYFLLGSDFSSQGLRWLQGQKVALQNGFLTLFAWPPFWGWPKTGKFPRRIFLGLPPRPFLAPVFLDPRVWQGQELRSSIKLTGLAFPKLGCSGALFAVSLYFGTFCQGMLGLNNFFCQLMDVFRIKPLKVSHFEQGSRKQPSLDITQGGLC